MKRVRTFSIAALLFSGMMVGTVITPVITAKADLIDSGYDGYVTNIFNYHVASSNAVIGQSSASGPIGYKTPLIAPKGYVLADPANNFFALTGGYKLRHSIEVVKLPQNAPVHTKISYIDAATNRAVGSQKLDGVQGQPMTLKAPNLYKIKNQNDEEYTMIPNISNKKVYVTRLPLKTGELVNQVKYRLPNSGIDICQTIVSGQLGKQLSVDVPAGYRLAFNQSDVFFISNTIPVHVITIEKDEYAVSTDLTFIEQGTNKVVGTNQVNGTVGQTAKVTFPTGFSAVNSADNKLALDPRMKTKAILVKKTGSNGGDVSSKNTTISVKNLHGASLYDANGKQVSRTLAFDSNWRTNQEMTLKDATYYQVATNTWANANDVYEYNTVQRAITVKNGINADLYTIYGTQVSRQLGTNTSWFSDKSAQIGGVEMYHVSTNEWVKASDIF